MSYPPPSQPDPYGQPDPYSQPGPPGQPAQFGQPAPIGQPSPYGTPAPKKSNTGKIIAIVVAVLALCCCGGLGIAAASGGFESFAEGFQEGLEDAAPSDAKVGDCVKEVAESSTATTDANLDVVDCTSSDASGKVIGIVTGISESDFRIQAIEEICDLYPTVEQAYWEGRTSSGQVWCIGPVD